MLQRNKTCLLIFLLLFLFSCSKKEKIKISHLIGKYNVVDSLKLNNSGFWYYGQRYKNFLIAVNKNEQRIEMYSLKGKLLSFLGNKGNGPGEFKNITRFDICDNDLYVIDKQKYTVTHIKINKTEMKYADEFKLTKQPTQICAISENKLLITFPGDIKNLKLFSVEGKILKEYSIPYREHFKNKKEYLESNYWIDNLDKKYFILGNISELKLYFCEFNPSNYDINVIKQRKINYHRKSKKFIFKNSNTRNIMGLSPIIHSERNYYISLRSDMKEIPETFFEVYDKSGNYIGNYNINGFKAVYKAFSDDGDTLWFKTIDDYDLLFVAKRRKNE